MILNSAVRWPKKSKNGEREELMKRAEITRGVIGRNCTTPSDSFVFFRFLRLNCRFEVDCVSQHSQNVQLSTIECNGSRYPTERSAKDLRHCLTSKLRRGSNRAQYTYRSCIMGQETTDNSDSADGRKETLQS